MSSGIQRFGKYELVKRAGRGGMAEVWKALDTQLNRYVAIKFLHPDLRTDPDFVMRFVREAQAIATLHHPNIVKIHDFQLTDAPSSEGKLAYMVMNFIEGPMLSEYIARTSRLGKYPPPADILNLFTSIGRAIDYAHQRGIIHRDIKPTNILLDEQDTLRHPMGNPVLTDFGIVKLMGTVGSTISGMMIGTPGYISPEQALGKPGNERSDIYSFGVILYEICTGVRPYQGDNAAAIIMQHISATPTPPHLINPKLPIAATNVILRCLAKAPEERFPDAASMNSALAQALNFPLPSNPGVPNPNSFAGDRSIGPDQANLGPRSFLSPPFTQDVGSHIVSGTFQNIHGLETPVQSRLSPAITPVFSESGLHVLTAGSQTSPGMTPIRPASLRRRHRGLLVALTILLILALLTVGLTTFYFVSHNQPIASTSIPTVTSSVGTVTFFSSVTDNGAGSQIPGIEDELHITLHNIATPAAGNSYYAWLVSDTGIQPIQAISLGKLSIIGGNTDFIYPHDQQDTNVLLVTSRFVIAEQNSAQSPGSFPSNTSAWRYYGEFPQKTDTSENPTSVLKDLRVLLSDEVFGLINSSQQVRSLAESVSNALDNKAAPTIHDEVIRILDYLDSALFVKTDIPAGPDLLVDPNLVQVPLLTIAQGQAPAGFISVTDSRLQSLLLDPGVTSNMVTLTNQALNALVSAQRNLEQVHLDAKQLVSMTNAQLLQPSARDLVNSMLVHARYADEGQTNSATDGIVFIGNTLQRLPTLDIKPYKP